MPLAHLVTTVAKQDEFGLSTDLRDQTLRPVMEVYRQMTRYVGEVETNIVPLSKPIVTVVNGVELSARLANDRVSFD